MMKLKYLLLGLAAIGFLGCKTSESSVKNIDGEMSREEFVAACNKRMSDPNEALVLGLMLKNFAGASDCNDAYEKVKAIAAKANG